MSQTTILRLMCERIIVPGYPQLVVTRKWLYRFLESRGWSAAERGIGSLDWMVFHAPAVCEALTDEDVRDAAIAEVERTHEGAWRRAA